MSEKGNFGILVGGGPAPGLNGVIASVTLEAHNQGYKIYGIYDGYKWLVKGDEKSFRANVCELTPAMVAKLHHEGGSFLRTSRTNPVKTPNGIDNAVKMLSLLDIQYMVTTGGDDTSYGASQIADAAKGKIKIAHVPKTIDNDLPLPNETPTFGYQTARELGGQLLKNLLLDAETTGRWYIVVVMGRTAGHLALGINKSAGGTLAIIPEEFGKNVISLEHLCDICDATILKRKLQGYSHGVLVVAEGVAEKLIESDLIKAIGKEIKLDQFNHIPLADVKMGEIIQKEIEKRFAQRGQKDFRVIPIDMGYVLRCSSPIPFDQEYTRDLGYHAVHYLLSQAPEHKENAIICISGGVLTPLYFKDMIDPKTGKTSVRTVSLTSPSYASARAFMTRLTRSDLDDPVIVEKMASMAQLTPQEFKTRYEKIV